MSWRHVDELTDELDKTQLRRFSNRLEDPAAREAAQSVVDHLDILTASKRGQFSPSRSGVYP